MSYAVEVAFKKLDSIQEMQDFCATLKIEASKPEMIKKIMESDYIFFPDWDAEAIKKQPKSEIWSNMALEHWITELFTFNWAYIDKLHGKPCGYLMMFWVPKGLHNLFDGVVYFQDSTDQDYSREDYSGLQIFEEIYDEIMRAKEDTQTLIEICNERGESYDEIKSDTEAIDHLLRAKVYSVIAAPVEKLVAPTREGLPYNDRTTSLALFKSAGNTRQIRHYMKAYAEVVEASDNF